MSVHSSEELLTTILLEVRRLIFRSKYSTVSHDDSVRMLQLARTGYEYLMTMIKLCNIFPRIIGTSYAELRALDAATQPERLKSAKELYNELWGSD